MSENLKESRNIKRKALSSSQIKMSKIMDQSSSRILRSAVKYDSKILNNDSESDPEDCIIIEPKIDVIEISDDDVESGNNKRLKR